MARGSNQQRAGQIAAIVIVTFVIMSSVVAGVPPSLLSSSQDADDVTPVRALQDSDDEFPPETDAVADPVVNYDKIDLNITLTNNRSDNSSLPYRLVVLGAIQSTNNTAAETVSCAEQTCIVNGTLDPEDRAAYRLSGAIVEVSPNDDLIGEFNNGTLEGNALEGLGIGAVFPTEGTGDGGGDGDTTVNVHVEASASAAASAVANTTAGSNGGGNGNDGGAGGTSNATLNESPTVESISYVNCSTVQIEGNGTVDRVTYNTVDYHDGGLDYRAPEETGVQLPYEKQWENRVIQNVEVTHEGEELAQTENLDNDACIEELGQRGNESFVDGVTYDDCSAAEIEGEGSGFGYTVTTEYYTEEGFTTSSWSNDNVTLPRMVATAVADSDTPVTSPIISNITVVTSNGTTVAEASNPEYDACLAEMEEEWEEYQNPGKGDYNCDDFDTWEEANEVYENSSGEHGLDDDGDGIPCEGLPGAPDDGNGGNGEDYNCEDFDTWEEADEVYQDSPGEHGLDGNGDGIPCEELPGAPGNGDTGTPEEPADEDGENESSTGGNEESSESTGDESEETSDETADSEGSDVNEGSGEGTDEGEGSDETSQGDEDEGGSNTTEDSAQTDESSGNGEAVDTDEEEMTSDNESALMPVSSSSHGFW